MTSAQRRSATILAGRLLSATIGVAAVRIQSELLPPGEIGRANLILGAYMWFGLLLVSPSGLFIQRYSVPWSLSGTLARNLLRYSYYLAGVGFTSGAVLWSVGEIQRAAGSTPMEIVSVWSIWLVAGNLVFATISGINSTCLNNLGYPGWYSGIAIGGSALGLGIAAGTCLFMTGRAEYWLNGLVLGQVVATGFSWLILAPRMERAKSSSALLATHPEFNLRHLLSFAGPLTLMTLCYWFQTDGFKFALRARATEEALGLFMVAFTVGGAPIAMLEKVLTDSFSPAFLQSISRLSPSHMAGAWQEYAGILFPCALAGTVFVGAMQPFLGRILVSPRLHGVSGYLFYGALVRALFLVTSAYLQWVQALGRTGIIIPAYIAGAICAIAGTYLLSAGSPMNGPGVSLTVAAAITAGLLILKVHSEHNLRIRWVRLGLAAVLVAPEFVFRLLVPTNSAPSARLSLLCLLLGGTYLGAVLGHMSGTLTLGRLADIAMKQVHSRRAGGFGERH